MASLVPRSLSSRLSPLLRRGASVSSASSPQRRLFATDFIRIDPMKDRESYKALINGILDMCKGLRQDGLHKESRDLHYQFYSGYENGLSHSKGLFVVAATMQIVVAFTQGRPLDALSLYNSFLENGKEPNGYMYAVVIKGLSRHGITTGEAKKTMIEMMGKRMKPNAATVVALMEGLVREGKAAEGRELVKDMKVCGLMPGDDDIEEVLEGKKGAVVENARNILFPNCNEFVVNNKPVLSSN